MSTQNNHENICSVSSHNQNPDKDYSKHQQAAGSNTYRLRVSVSPGAGHESEPSLIDWKVKFWLT